MCIRDSFNAVRRLQDELAGLGVAAPCLGSAYADRRVIDELVCTPTFTRSVYGRLYATPGEFVLQALHGVEVMAAQRMHRRVDDQRFHVGASIRRHDGRAISAVRRAIMATRQRHLNSAGW